MDIAGYHRPPAILPCCSPLPRRPLPPPIPRDAGSFAFLTVSVSRSYFLTFHSSTFVPLRRIAMPPFPPSPCAQTRDSEATGMIEACVDPALWKLELERVTPRLREAVSTSVYVLTQGEPSNSSWYVEGGGGKEALKHVLSRKGPYREIHG